MDTDSNELARKLWRPSAYGLDGRLLEFLHKGADPDRYLPLHEACLANQPRCAELLIKWGASLSLVDAYGQTPLHWACKNNSLDCARVLMSHNSPTGITDKQGKSAIALAREEGNNDMAEFISNYKPLPKEPLSTYPSYKELSQLQVHQWEKLGSYFELTKDQIESIRRNERPSAATFIAAKVKNLELKWKNILEGLLSVGEYELAEHICIEQGVGHTALYVCAFYGWLNFMRYLVDTRGLDPRNPVNKAGDTILAVTCTWGHIDVIKYLVKDKGWDPDGPVNSNGDSLRSLAESHGLSEVIDCLSTDSTDLEKQKYMHKLDELFQDTRNTILLHYLKLHFIGSSGLGKTTTRNRLTGLITNVVSLPEEERQRCSTHLAEFSQVLAMTDEDGPKLTLQVAANPMEETRTLFAYVYSSKATNPEHTSPTTGSSESSDQHSLGGDDQPISTSIIPSTNMPGAAMSENLSQPAAEVRKSKQVVTTVTVDVHQVIARLRDVVSSGKYTEQLLNKILLNLVDIGGQPGFLEMLPFLSKGPGMFLAFFRLDKDLDEPCEVSYEREGDKITPYPAIYTIRETLSQILSAINHHVSLHTALDQELLSKLGDLAFVQPVATLVGTFKDKLKMNIMIVALLEKLSTKFPKASENEKEKVIKHALASSSEVQSGDQFAATVDTDMLSMVNQLLVSESFKKEMRDRLDQELRKKNIAISSVTCNFKELLFHPDDGQHFIALDNFTGTEADIDPLREHLQKMFNSFFKGAQLRIRPPQLLLGVILRKEYDIVSMADCILIGKALNMDEEEVKFCIWYLDRWVGALIYHPEIDDEECWFKKYIICSPQVVFDSISSLIVETLLEFHCPKRRTPEFGFTAAEKENWIVKGQFTLAMVKRCLSEKNKEKLKHCKLIPVDMLVKFLEHSNLLSLITTIKEQGGRETEEVMCFVPAILKCASPEELAKSPPPDPDTPSPIKISFKTGYVPIGMFCALISQLVSRGSARDGILGMRWELVESGVKRNLVSFRVDSVKHSVTLIAHVNCYEIRIIRQDRDISLHDLCSYVLSTVLYVMKEVNDNICPIIAFDCKCGRQHSPHQYHLCQLKPGVATYFECVSCSHKISLTADQECWFVKEVTVGEDVTLEALPFADPDPTLSFKWIKPGRKTLKCKENELPLEKVTQAHCRGFYTCEISKDKKPYFSVYYCLRATSDAPLSDEDQLFDEVRQAVKEVRADWYSLAIELDIDYGTRKAIESDCRFVDVCFHAVLRHLVRRTSPSRMWTTLVRALESPVINRRDIAEEIEPKLELNVNTDISSDPDTSIVQTPLKKSGSLNLDTHLRLVREVTWPMRADWYLLGEQLGITEGTRKAIGENNRTVRECADMCFTALLEHWLIQTSPPPTWETLIKALRTPVIRREGIAASIETMLKNH